MKHIDVVIIGAGAAGLMCAIEAAKRRRSVLVIESSNKPGKKILMSGGGRCNFTNLNTSSENFISHNPRFCKSALSRYTPYHFLDLIEKYNIAYHEKTLGQLFCNNKSKDILNMLLSECEAAKVTIELNCNVNTINQITDNQFILNTNTDKVTCQSLVIATGGLSIPTLGSSPYGYRVAQQFKIDVKPTRAGLVPFTLHVQDKEKYADLSGIAMDAIVTCNKTSFAEAILFTHRGLSGPAILQISSYWQPGDTVMINFAPDINLFEELVLQQQKSPTLHLKNYLQHFFPKRLISTFIDEQLANKDLQSCSHKIFQEVAALFHHWKIIPNNTEGYRTAEVTIGGVDCNAVSSKTFEANSVKGLYFIGEVLDVTGWLGGYNFQWAWASGHAAGQVV